MSSAPMPNPMNPAKRKREIPLSSSTKQAPGLPRSLTPTMNVTGHSEAPRAPQVTAKGAKRARKHTSSLDNDSSDANGGTSRPSSTRTTSSESNAEEPEQQAADKPNMPPPEKAGRAPKGYHLNPPPPDRAVRVYADGVFDLFHLGYVLQIPLNAYYGGGIPIIV